MDKHYLRKQVNSSGFPFQLQVERLIKDSSDNHKWSLLSPEHPWKNQESGKEGFIDLILERQLQWDLSWYMVVECKRIKRPGTLVFLNPYESRETSDAYILLGQRQQDEKLLLSWGKYHPRPITLVSSFCTVPGQGDKETPMLERVSAQLLDSVECLAEEELSIEPQRTFADVPTQIAKKAVYIPVIVTNSELVVCQFDPMAADLLEGELPDNVGEFKTIPYIRFQKSMPTRFTTDKIPTSLRQANLESQRTVIVVHAPSFPELLRGWDFF